MPGGFDTAVTALCRKVRVHCRDLEPQGRGGTAHATLQHSTARPLQILRNFHTPQRKLAAFPIPHSPFALPTIRLVLSSLTRPQLPQPPPLPHIILFLFFSVPSARPSAALSGDLNLFLGSLRYLRDSPAPAPAPISSKLHLPDHHPRPAYCLIRPTKPNHPLICLDSTPRLSIVSHKPLRKSPSSSTSKSPCSSSQLHI